MISVSVVHLSSRAFIRSVAAALTHIRSQKSVGDKSHQLGQILVVGVF
jgi:hypothetical protein